MKVGLLTFFQDDCAGQYYQALATFNTLREAFPEGHVEIVNLHHSRRWRPWVGGGLRRFALSIVKHFKYHQARAKNFVISSPELIPETEGVVNHYLAAHGYDLLVVGSDVCLKIQKDKEGRLPNYWLSSDIGIPHLMLSSSSEFTTCKSISEAQRIAAKKSFQQYSFAGVRDTMTVNFLSELAPDCVQKICLMPDPTMSLSVDRDAEVAKLKNLKKKVGKEFCMVNLVDTPLCRELVHLLSKDCYVVEVGPRVQGSSTCFVPGPDEWNDMFNHFDLVVTTSFHESIFSLKHQTPVVAIDCNSSRFVSVSGNSKTKYLMHSLGLERCHINPDIQKMTAQQVYDQIIQVRDQFDWSELGSRFEKMGTQYRATVSAAIERVKAETINEDSNC
ncbi:polysaccharide pyruvyl transferase family protein [Desulforhopalus vacuolatus]|uniref:polysaccharide pyruvyl transferase family protein n=1 Tax=Desulforhopalus vacuolatus TaxID=40414 RepID=UPI001966463B|nr:polysaccharide pyruvyl transferase family protein [Desulforhopalus vacuolatus]MBM9520471.1 polysaccharide pyruvyl transferase family protein [Desulforhopalus vacuolatus]